MKFRARDYLTRPAALVRMRRWMGRTRGWDPEQLREWQLRRLRDLLVHAQSRVPFYQEHLVGMDPASIRNLDDWSQLPVLDRDTVRERVDDLRSDDARRHAPAWCHTSGTTGSPLRVLHDRHVNAAALALFARQWSEAGWRVGQRQVVLAGDAPYWSYQRLTRIYYVPMFAITEDTVPRFIETVRRYRPTLVRGQPSAMSLLARLLERNGAEVSVAGAVTHSEMLLPAHREQIERTFGVRVIDHYTHWERVGSIGQCRAGRYHVHSDFGYVEILRDDASPAAPGETGRVVATGLHNRAMPLLRYDTRDQAAWAKEQRCDCGSRFPVVESIQGRSDDFVITPEGRHVKLSNAFKHLEYVREAQVVQRERHRVLVRVVPEPGYEDSSDEESLLRELRLRLGDTIRIDVERRTDLPRTRGGKTRLIVSELTSPGDVAPPR